MRSKFPALLSVVFLALAIGLSQTVASAQFGPPPAESPAEKRKKAKQKFKTSVMDRAMDIPSVPNYPSSRGASKFIRALRYSSLGHGDNCIVQTFYLKDQPESVLEFYNAQLVQNGWLVAPANSSGNQILARKRKQGSSCHLMITPCPDKNWKTAVQLRYVQFQPLPD